MEQGVRNEEAETRWIKPDYASWEKLEKCRITYTGNIRSNRVDKCGTSCICRNKPERFETSQIKVEPEGTHWNEHRPNQRGTTFRSWRNLKQCWNKTGTSWRNLKQCWNKTGTSWNNVEQARNKVYNVQQAGKSETTLNNLRQADKSGKSWIKLRRLKQSEQSGTS